MWKKQPPDSSTKISKFYAPTDTEHKSNEKEIKTWLPINSVWDHFHWETYSTVLKSDNHHVALHQPLIEQKPITKVLIIYKHSTHWLHNLPCGRSYRKLSNPWGRKMKSWIYLSSLFHLINTRNKKVKP